MLTVFICSLIEETKVKMGFLKPLKHLLIKSQRGKHNKILSKDCSVACQ